MNIKQCGMSLIEVMITVGILGIVAVGTISLVSFQTREMRAMSEKVEVLEIEKVVLRALHDGSVCTFEMTDGNGKQFDASRIGSPVPPTIELQKIRATPQKNAPSLVEVGAFVGASNPTDPSPTSSSLKVRAIKVENIKNAGIDDRYLADLFIYFDSSHLVRQLKPIRIPTTLQTDPNSNLAGKKVKSCMAGSMVTTGLFCNTYNEDPAGPNLFGCESPVMGFCHIPSSDQALFCTLSGLSDNTMSFTYPYSTAGRTYHSAQVPCPGACSQKCEVQPDPRGGWMMRAYFSCAMVSCSYSCLFMH